MASNGRGIRVVIYDKQRRVSVPQLRQTIFDPIRSYRDFATCFSFIQRHPKDHLHVLLISTTDDPKVLEQFQSLPAIEAILILSTVHRSVNLYPEKVWGIYLHIDSLLHALPEQLDTIEDRLNSNSVIFHRQSGILDNPAFYFYPLWQKRDNEQNKPPKKTSAGSKRQFLRHARLLFPSNHWLKPFIDRFEYTYRSREVLTWLEANEHPFPYHRLLSFALRTHQESILNNARFFLDDLTEQLHPAGQTASENQVYLGTKLSTTLLERLNQQRANDVVAFQCFLNTCPSRVEALREATRVVSRRTDLHNVLFKIELNQCPCVRIGDRTIVEMATPFRIRYVTKTDDGPVLHMIKLVALSNEQKQRLYRSYRDRQEKKSQTPRKKTTPRVVEDHEAIADDHAARREFSLALERLHRIREPSVRVLNKIGAIQREHARDLPKALDFHRKALAKAVDDERGETLLYLGKVHQDLKDYDEALKCFSDNLHWYEEHRETDGINIARCLVGIANAQRGRKHLDAALDAAERALAIREHQIEPKNEFDIAASLGTIGNILHDQGDFYRALVYAKKAVEILFRCGQGDPRLAAALNNLGAMYQTNGDTIKAREYFQKAIEALPSEDHPYGESATVNLAQIEANDDILLSLPDK